MKLLVTKTPRKERAETRWRNKKKSFDNLTMRGKTETGKKTKGPKEKDGKVRLSPKAKTLVAIHARGNFQLKYLN